MFPGVYPLQVYCGDTQTWQFVLWQDAAKTVPLDLTGATASSQIRVRPEGALLVDMSPSITIALPNTINMTITSEQSESLPQGIWAWDLQVTFAAGNVQTVLAGPVPCTPDVTSP